MIIWNAMDVIGLAILGIAGLVMDGYVIICHIGDSRVYNTRIVNYRS